MGDSGLDKITKIAKLTGLFRAEGVNDGVGEIGNLASGNLPRLPRLANHPSP